MCSAQRPAKGQRGPWCVDSGVPFFCACRGQGMGQGQARDKGTLFRVLRGYGLKYRGARGTPLTRGPEADGTKIMTAARPQHLHNTRACGRQNGGSTVQCARPVRLPPTCAPRHTRRRHGVQVQEQLWRRALHARANGLDAADHLLCEGTVCTREFVTESLRRCHAAPKRCGSELEL